MTTQTDNKTLRTHFTHANLDNQLLAKKYITIMSLTCRDFDKSTWTIEQTNAGWDVVIVDK